MKRRAQMAPFLCDKGGALDASTASVFLVGSTVHKSSPLENHLAQKGCRVSLASSEREAIETLKRCQFDIVLSEFLLADGSAYHLIPLLVATGTTMFFSYAVEDSCWWMIAVCDGKACSDRPGMTPREFTILLDKTIEKSRLRNTVQASGRLHDDWGKSMNQEGIFDHICRESAGLELSSYKEGEVQRRSNSNPLPYFLMRAETNTETTFRQWNKVLISILGMLVLEILLVAFVPQQGSGSNNQTNYIKAPTYSNRSLGIEVKAVNSGIGHELNNGGDNSEVVISSVGSASKGAKAGLESGDIILKVNQKPISGVDDFERSVDENPNHSVCLVVERKNGSKSVIEIGAK